MSATLRVRRELSFGIELRRGQFDVCVDDQAVGTVNRDETLETPVEAGHHSVQVRKGRYSSRSESFDVRDGEVVDFRCYGARLWPVYVASIVAPKLAIALSRE
jgi:hypothetical protein